MLDLQEGHSTRKKNYFLAKILKTQESKYVSSKESGFYLHTLLSDEGKCWYEKHTLTDGFKVLLCRSEWI